MNGSCAGGTGAFIDQWRRFEMSADEMDAAAQKRRRLHHRLPLRRVRQERRAAPDQPGRPAEDISASIYQRW
jgi:hypothetical protein